MAAHPEELGERFLRATEERGVQLYAKQQEAIVEVFSGCHVALSTPTGSGKSLVAEAMLFRAAAEGRRAYYTCPIKALVSEKFFDLCRDFGPRLVGMTTGDVSVNSQAPLICCTAEVLASIALRDGRAAPVDFVVMDEFHYYSDKSRGFAWEAPLLRLPHVTFLLMSATMGQNPRIYASLEQRTGRAVRVVASRDRPVPLDWSYRPRGVLNCIVDLVGEGRSPVYVVNFTQREAAALAFGLVSKQELQPTAERKKALLQAVDGMRFDSPYGPRVRELLVNGIGLHHAGLLPKYRLLAEQMAQAGILTCISGTDTLGVGVNVPIRSVLFTQLCKFNGEDTVILPARDFHQIAGRAGRRGFDDQGSVLAVPPQHVVENLKVEAKMNIASSIQEKTKLRNRLQKPPTTNFRHWDEATFEELRKSEPEALESQFQISQGAVLSLLQGAQEHGRDGAAELQEYISAAHCSKERRAFWGEQADLYTQALLSTGLVSQTADSELTVTPGLQQDFFLMEDVSLFLVEVLPLLQWEYSSDERGYARAVLSLCEALCEGPKSALQAQARCSRERKNDDLKRKGVAYEARKAEVEALDYRKPVPGGKLLRDAFEGFLRSHPWVDREALQPKALALELWEGQLTFSEFVERLSKDDKEKAVMRQEGLLLRYITQVHKTIRHNVPDEFKSDVVLEVEAFLLATINETDSSLLRQWESLKALEASDGEALADAAAVAAAAAAMRGLGPAVEEEASGGLGARPETELELRALRSRVRVEVRRLVRRLARGDWPAALRGLRLRLPGSDKEEAWTSDKLKAAAIAKGITRAGDCEEVGLEMEETLDGFRVFLEMQSEHKGGTEPFHFGLEAFAPWPVNLFEPLLELHDIS